MEKKNGSIHFVVIIVVIIMVVLAIMAFIVWYRLQSTSFSLNKETGFETSAGGHTADQLYLERKEKFK